MNTERQKILKKLMHSPLMSFNELWNKEGESNKFAYHLKVLEEDNFIQKSDEGYQLTHQGKKYVAYLEGKTGERSQFPLMGVIIVILNEENNKVLMQKRTKEPFYGYWGYVGGKLKFSQYILECAKEEIKEETGLECDVELKGLFSSKTYNNDSLSYNHQMFVVKATNPKGTLIKENREGVNLWFKIEDISNLKTFPNIQNSLSISLSKGFKWVEADRFQENDEFKDIKIVREEEF